MTYDYTLHATSGAWTVHVDPVKKYGWMERDGEAVGGLWFDTGRPLRLVDQDGTYSTPRGVIVALRSLGIVVPREFE